MRATRWKHAGRGCDGNHRPGRLVSDTRLLSISHVPNTTRLQMTRVRLSKTQILLLPRTDTSFGSFCWKGFRPNAHPSPGAALRAAPKPLASCWEPAPRLCRPALAGSWEEAVQGVLSALRVAFGVFKWPAEVLVPVFMRLQVCRTQGGPSLLPAATISPSADEESIQLMPPASFFARLAFACMAVAPPCRKATLAIMKLLLCFL